MLKMELDADDMIDPTQSPKFIAAATCKGAVKAEAQAQLFSRD